MMYSYLPVTQNWVYTQITSTICSHSVVSITEEHPEQFPLEKRYTAFTTSSLANKIKLIMARYWVRQPTKFLNSTVNTLRPDCIHGHFATESWRILASARRFNIPLVTTFYGLDVDKLSRKQYWKKRYPQLFSYGSAFVVEGPFMGKRLEVIGCSSEKVHVIPLGVTVESYQPHCAKKEGPIQVLFTGLSREKKGPLDAARIFIEAAKVNKMLHLSVIGDGCYRKKFELLMHEAGLSERVTMHGYCIYAAYLEILAKSDVVLVPSVSARDGDTEGGAPVVCIEAQVSGIPVVGTSHCDIPFIVHDKKGGFLSSEHDIASMTAHLLQLAESHQIRCDMGNYARSHAMVQHDKRRQTALLAGVYEQVCRVQHE